MTLLDTFSLLILISVFLSGKTEDDSPLLVSLDQGKLRGFRDVSSHGKTIYSFLSVPFAAPPVGKLRFMEPQEPDNWTGVRDATIMLLPCSQIKYDRLLAAWEKAHRGEEDCLMLNVFSADTSNEAALPVMVFIHGGGYVGNAARDYASQDLLNEDIVLVVIQYRLGALGFLSTEDSVIPGNIGLKDQTQALRWVNKNIHKFGGDAEKVTIFGESAGSSSVHAHILSPYSNGLFSRAIMQSGTMLCPWARMIKPRETAMVIGEHFGCFKDSSELKGKERSQALLNCLQSVDAGMLQEATHQLFKWSFLPKRTVPYVDGDFFPEDIETLTREGKFKPVDVIIGVNKDEGAFVSNAILVMDDQRKAIKSDFATIGPISLAFENEEDALKLSRKAYDFYVGGVKNDLKDYKNLSKMYGDHHFAVCSDWTALFQSKINNIARRNTFYYELHYRSEVSLVDLFGNPIGRGSGVSHGDELFHLFPMDIIKSWKRDEDDLKMVKIFTKLWTNFAKYGNPTPDDSLGFRWKEFNEESPSHLKLLPNPTMEEDTRKKERDFWRSLPTSYNNVLFKTTPTRVKIEL